MEICCNSLYFISNSFFTYVCDPNLKINKTTGNRPHYYSYHDENTGLLWMIPCSSQIDKYKSIIDKKITQGKPHNHIKIFKISGKEQVLLFQDMFPILPHYIESEYKNSLGTFKLVDPKKINEIQQNSKKIIELLRRNIKFTHNQPDILRIEALMICESNRLSK